VGRVRRSSMGEDLRRRRGPLGSEEIRVMGQAHRADRETGCRNQPSGGGNTPHIFLILTSSS
jgi:hypothetical protein